MIGRPGRDAPHPVLELRDLTVALPPGADRRLAVEGIGFSVRSNQTFCLVGESGSGKSVTALAALGMLPPTLSVERGEILLEGVPLPPPGSGALERLRGARIGMIFQEPTASLNPVMRVGQQIEDVLRVHGVTGRARRRTRVRELLQAVRLPESDRLRRSYPHQLSGGQCQRIVIAMALALDPVLLIADEPTTALDVTTQAEILRLIAELQAAKGMAVLFITHDFGVVAEIADWIAVMREGAIVETGAKDQVLRRPRHPYTRALLAATPRKGEAADSSRPEVPVLEAVGLHLSYRLPAGLFRDHRLDAVRDVSLTLRRGQTLGVVGESGSGKTSLARCLLRLEQMDAGRILLHGQDISLVSGAALRAVRKTVQVVLQDPYSALDPRQKTLDAVAEGPRIHGQHPSRARQRARDLLDLVGLPPQAAERYPHEFSGGQRQRICIARALAVEPEVLIADEAVSALDLSIQAQILDLFRSLQEQLGFAMLFITHDLRVAAAICDEIMVMRHGQVVEHRPTDELFGDPRETYTRDLLAAVPGKLQAPPASLHGPVVIEGGLS